MRSPGSFGDPSVFAGEAPPWGAVRARRGRAEGAGAFSPGSTGSATGPFGPARTRNDAPHPVQRARSPRGFAATLDESARKRLPQAGQRTRGEASGTGDARIRT